MAKIRLRIYTYKQGSRIASIPMKKLKKLAECKKRRWHLDVLNGNVWLTLEAF